MFLTSESHISQQYKFYINKSLHTLMTGYCHSCFPFAVDAFDNGGGFLFQTQNEKIANPYYKNQFAMLLAQLNLCECFKLVHSIR